MFARVTTFTFDPTRQAEARRISETRILPRLQQQPGFHSMTVLGDLATGEGTVVTIWDSEESEVASRTTVGQSFGSLRDILTGSPGPGRVYSVVHSGHAVAVP